MFDLNIKFLFYILKVAILSLSTLFSFVSYSDNKTLSVAIPTEDYAPFIIIKNEHVSGLLVDPLRLAAQKIGVKLIFKFLPEKRSQEMLSRHLIDARIDSSTWVKNSEAYLWSEPIVLIEEVFIYHKNSITNFETNEALNGAEIVTHFGYSYPNLQVLMKNKLINRKDYSSGLEMLSSLIRPIDGVNRAAVMNKEVALRIIKNTPKLKNIFLFSKRVVGSASLQFQFAKNKGLEITVNQLNTEFKKIKEAKLIGKQL